MEHQIGAFTAKVMKMSLADLQKPTEEAVLGEHLALLQKVLNEAQHADYIKKGGYSSLAHKVTQLKSTQKKIQRLVEEAEVVIKVMDRRTVDARTSQDVMIDVLREAEEDFARKKASAIYILNLASDTAQKVEALLDEIV